MGQSFECRFIQDWEYTKQLYLYTVKQNRKWGYFWCAFALLLVGVTVNFFLVEHSPFFGTIYLLITVFAVWRGFGGLFRVRRRWKKDHAGKEMIESVFTFGDRLRISANDGVALEVEWFAAEKLKLREFGPYLKFTGLEKKSFYLPRTGFEDGTGQAFLDWIAREHPMMLG